MAGVVPHIRAAFVLVHLVALTLQALPAPGGGMRRSAWEDPTVQDEFRAWTGRLNALGWQGEVDDLEEVLWTAGTAVNRTRSALLRPFRHYYRYAGTWQSWRMFVAPHRYPARLHVDVLERDGWRTVYVGRSREHAWLRQQLDHDRMRAAVFRYAWPPYRNTYKQFVAWIADRAAHDFPDASVVRVRFWKARTPSAAEVLAGEEPEGAWIETRTRKLAR